MAGATRPRFISDTTPRCRPLVRARIFHVQCHQRITWQAVWRHVIPNIGDASNAFAIENVLVPSHALAKAGKEPDCNTHV